MTAGMRKGWSLATDEKSLEDRANKLRPITDMSRRSPEVYVKMGYVGVNQPWGSAERWFELGKPPPPAIQAVSP